MPEFAYTAVEPRTGRESRGTLVSADSLGAAADLRNRGLAPTAIAPAAPIASGGIDGLPPSAAAEERLWGFRPLVSRRGLTQFTRQLATLLKAGLPLLRALEVLARSERNRAFRTVLLELADRIRAGGSLSDGLRTRTKVFDELYVTMVKAGEAGGVLERVLDRLATFLERTERIKGRVKAAMTYPVIIMIVSAGILTGLMVFVVPKFQQIFAGVLRGQPLPPLTRLVIGAGEFIRHNWAAVLGMLVLLFLSAHWFLRSRSGRRCADWVLLHLPLVGEIFLKAAIARFTRTFGSLLASGVPMLEAMVLTRPASGNVHVAAALVAVHDRIQAGAPVARALQASGVFPALLTSMVEVGEETGDLSDMLGRVADSYDEEVDNAVTGLTAIVEPVMIVVMALVVGVIVIALFLPMVRILQYLQ